MTNELVEVIAVSRIKYPRHTLHKEKGDMEELKRSITAVGLLHPVIVRPVDNHYELIAGSRRYQALSELGWKEMKVGADVKVVVADDKHAFEMALIENMARKDMEAEEEGAAFQLYINEHGWGSTNELAEKINRSPSYVSRRIDLLNLAPENFARLKSAGMSVEHAVEVSKLDNEQATEFTDLLSKTGFDRDMTRKAVSYVEQGWTPRQAIQRTLDFPERPVPKEGSKRDVLEELREDIENILSQALNKMDERIRDMPEGEERAKWIGRVRSPLHDLKSEAMKIRKEVKKDGR